MKQDSHLKQASYDHFLSVVPWLPRYPLHSSLLLWILYHIVTNSYSSNLLFISLRLYSIRLTLCVLLYHYRFLLFLELCIHSGAWSIRFLYTLGTSLPLLWFSFCCVISFLSSEVHSSHFPSLLSFPFCPHQHVVLISSLSFESSRKVSTNPQTAVLSSCVLQSFPAAVFSIYVAQGPAFRREFLYQNNVETVLLPRSREQIRRPIQTRR